MTCTTYFPASVTFHVLRRSSMAIGPEVFESSVSATRMSLSSVGSACSFSTALVLCRSFSSSFTHFLKIAR